MLLIVFAFPRVDVELSEVNVEVIYVIVFFALVMFAIYNKETI